MRIQEINLDWEWQDPKDATPGRCYEFRFASIGLEKSIAVELVAVSDWHYFRTDKGMRLEDFECGGSVTVTPGLQLGLHGFSGPMVLVFDGPPRVNITFTAETPQLTASLGGHYVGKWRFTKIIH